MIKSLMLLLLFLHSGTPVTYEDNDNNCGSWAEDGECQRNPGYMLKECAKSCNLQLAESNELADIKYFYDLSAKDIDGNVLDFEIFRSQIVVIVNVASHCGYTESHYTGLVELFDKFSDTHRFVILAFPCNQFGNQEPDEPSVIKEFAVSKGVKFTMMQKIDVNGARTHMVYQFLKKEVGPTTIDWNFANYFLVSPDGSISSHSGVKPSFLQDVVYDLFGKEGEF